MGIGQKKQGRAKFLRDESAFLIPKGVKTPKPSLTVVRDDDYRAWLKTQPCIITGRRPEHGSVIDPLHVGTYGKGIKSPDNEMLPVFTGLHRQGHSSGEVSMFRQFLPDDVIRDALRAYAREMHARYLQERS
jgi:hypothetical protein